MKKAKIMLAAIAVVTIAGSTLAFKTHRGLEAHYSICNPGFTTCTETTIDNATTTVVGVGVKNVGTTAADVVGKTCSEFCPSTDFTYTTVAP